MDQLRNYAKFYRPKIGTPCQNAEEDLFITEQGKRLNDDALSRYCLFYFYLFCIKMIAVINFFFFSLNLIFNFISSLVPA